MSSNELNPSIDGLVTQAWKQFQKASEWDGKTRIEGARGLMDLAKFLHDREVWQKSEIARIKREWEEDQSEIRRHHRDFLAIQAVLDSVQDELRYLHGGPIVDAFKQIRDIVG